MWKKLSVIIPVLNEEENIPILIDSLQRVLGRLGSDYELIFIDDGSIDNSFSVLAEFHKNDSRVKIIKFRTNFGQTAAFLAGFEYSQGEVIITIDADLQNDPEDIPILLQKIEEGYDVVSGWRYKRKDPLFTKRIPSRLSNWLASKLTDVHLRDFGCTLKAYTKESVKGLEIYGEIHRYIPAIINWRGFKIGEVKVRHHPRRYGKTKYNFWRLIKGLLDLINIKFWTQYSVRPLHFFGILGIGSFTIGFLLGLYLVILRLIFLEPIGDKPLLLLSVLLIVFGVQFITFGFLADILTKIYYTKANGRKTYEIESIIE